MVHPLVSRWSLAAQHVVLVLGMYGTLPNVVSFGSDCIKWHAEFSCLGGRHFALLCVPNGLVMLRNMARKNDQQ